jgi:hypothetical protein
MGRCDPIPFDGNDADEWTRPDQWFRFPVCEPHDGMQAYLDVFVPCDGGTLVLSEMEAYRLLCHAMVQRLPDKAFQRAAEALVEVYEVELRSHFSDLARRWKDETLFTSSSSDLYEHEAYKAIIQLGDGAVPLILAELEREPDHWFFALRTITGSNPVLPEDAGDVLKMASAWITWGKEHGYRW